MSAPDALAVGIVCSASATVLAVMLVHSMARPKSGTGLGAAVHAMLDALA